LFIINDRLQSFLRKLALKDFFLNSTGSEEAIRKTTLLLSITPTSSGSLFVYSGVPGSLLPGEKFTYKEVKKQRGFQKLDMM